MTMLIQAYDPQWRTHFHLIQELLKNELNPLSIEIEHIGSTAVPDLAAKAIIDIDIIYSVESEFLLIKNKLAKLGYYHNGNQGIPQREAFKRDKRLSPHPVLDQIAHHLYACPTNSPELKRHLLFRDFLRQHAWAREEYQALKIAIAKETNQDKKQYSLLKETAATAFIEKVLQLAS